MGITGPNELEDAVSVTCLWWANDPKLVDMSRAPHVPPILPKCQDYHGVIPPAYRVIDPGHGHQRKEKRRIKKSTMGSRSVAMCLKDLSMHLKDSCCTELRADPLRNSQLQLLQKRSDVNVLINQRARAIEEARELEAALYAKRQEIAKCEEEIAEYRTLKVLLPV
ncbi:hypothetical protein RRG08_018947 [Elysia crispata]|uniref:Uncharacterized protein n=1 Tax=Elysia crispata TaxID=231223 RepID=A0AAE1DT38_9GAST|nr:hypothetical protein RRG08_018947 [Elysia crispata]